MRYDAIRRRVNRICSDHALMRIEIIIRPGTGADGYIASAMPEAYHRIVEDRWRKASVQHGGSVDIKQLTTISDNAMRSVAQATGSSIEGVLKALDARLTELDTAP